MMSAVLLVVSALFITQYTAAPCPCVFPKNYENKPLIICHNSESLLAILKNATDVKEVAINNTDILTFVGNKCSVYISIEPMGIQQTTQRRICPDSCVPVPIAKFPAQLLQQSGNMTLEHYKDYPITCSLTLGMSVKKHAAGISINIVVSQLFVDIARRLVMECDEHAHRSSENSVVGDIYLPPIRRKVFAVIIWVGAASNVKLIMNQAIMLTEEPFHGTQGVVAWAATDYLYGCTKEETVCKGNLGWYRHLPHTSMNQMSFGWKCAQRRPLRALAHVLALFDPEFIVSLDDDTFLNYQLLMQRYGSYILSTMHTEPIVLGEFLGRTGSRGHLTTEGLFAGGSGYILGNKVLSRLQRKEIYAVGSEVWSDKAGAWSPNDRFLDAHVDVYRSKSMLKFLSVLGEGVEAAVQTCPSAAVASAVSASAMAGGSVAGQNDGVQLQRSAEWRRKYAADDVSTNRNTCVLSLKPRPAPYKATSKEKNYQTVPIGVRLIDFCTNLMANANTCHHR